MIRDGSQASTLIELGAEDGGRTRDLNLGKVALYQLSYFRTGAMLAPPGKLRQPPNQVPVDPNPPLPRSESGSSSASSHRTSGSPMNNNWAIRSPRLSVTDLGPVVDQ